MRTIADLIERVRSEFVEMPGLQLIPAQVQRLCGIEQKICQVVLDSLVKSNVLTGKRDGRYALVTARYPPVSGIGEDGASQSASPAPPLAQSDGPRHAPETLILRQPERRRHGCDAEVRKERAQWVRQWN